MNESKPLPSSQPTATLAPSGIYGGATPLEFSRVEQGGVLGVVASLAFGILAWRSRLSKTNKQVGEDKAEGSFLTTVMKDRDAAVLVASKLTEDHSRALALLWEERAKSAARIASLESKNQYQADRITSLESQNQYQAKQAEQMQDEIARVRHELRTMKRSFQESGFGPFEGSAT